MKQRRYVFITAFLVIGLLGSFSLFGCAGKGVAPADTRCNAKIEWQVVKEVQLTRFVCAVGKHGGQPSLIFTVGLKNPTENPLRYRVNIFLEDMDKAAGYFVPRKGKPPVVKPGQETTIKIPFIGLNRESKKILVVVKTVGS
ncbi:MAG: hypothetical protein JRJ03_14815 [Deltaproteobacteria bacterium]|nr:hypothetical protein [Deltaproteobacteria bacterium]